MNLNEERERLKLHHSCSIHSRHALTIIVHPKTHKGENHHEISRIASQLYTFPNFHTADSDLNCCYIFRTWCLILVTIVVTGCLPGALGAKDPSRNWLRVRKMCHNSLDVHLKTTSSWSFLGFFCLFGKDF